MTNLSHVKKHLDKAFRKTGVPAQEFPEYVPEKVVGLEEPSVFVHLDNLNFDHLEVDQFHRLDYAVTKARKWIRSARDDSGLSFVLAGGVGTGKTTIAQNLLSSFTQMYSVSVAADEEEFKDLIKRAVGSVEDRPDLAQAIEEYPDLLASVTLSIPKGVMVEATRLMEICENQRDMEIFFKKQEVIVVDDVGEEEIPYTNEASLVEKRRRRYGRFVDHCERNGKRIIVTSMVSIMDHDGQGGWVFNPKFVEIFGGRAFSRLQLMAHGYMCDLTGLPDYREVKSG